MKFTDVRKYATGLLSASFVNKEVLDNLAENESGSLTYKGAAIEGGGGGTAASIPDNVVLYAEDGEVTEIPEVSGGGSGSGVSIIDITQAEYDALENKQDSVLYNITDSEEYIKAENVEYNNSESGLVADNTQDAIDEVNDKADAATNIAKGRNQAHVFSTTEAMQTWLSNEENKGKYKVGDNLYIVDVDVPDWWVSEVLTEVDASTGYYYKIAQLETQKVDLTEIENEIDTLQDGVGTINSKLGTTDISSVGNGTVTGAISTLNSNLVKETHLLNNNSINSWVTVGNVSSYRMLEFIVFDGDRQQRGQLVIGVLGASRDTSGGKPIFIYRGDKNEIISQFYVSNNILYLYTYVGYSTEVYYL